jgi:ribosomal protein L14E/L6E/L27E
MRDDIAMNIRKARMLAVSRAGHDRDTVYVVLEEADGYCLLCDGKRKLLAAPKKKKQIHLQIIKNLPEALRAQMEEIKDDADIRRILKEYRKSQIVL